MAPLPSAGLVLFFMAVGAVGAGLSPASEPPGLTLAAASSLQYALDRIDSAFTQRHGIAVKVVYGSSGKLAAQAKSGAPFDLFLSADMAYPDSLHAWGLAAGKPVAYARGTVVIWTLREDLDLRRGLAVLGDAGIRKVAIPDPALAPYGKAALAALEQAGLARALEKKLVFAQSVGQSGQFILSGAVDAGFSALSVVAAPALRGKIGKSRWAALDSSQCPSILHGAVALKGRSETSGARQGKFLLYLASREARKILRQSGYRDP